MYANNQSNFQHDLSSNFEHISVISDICNKPHIEALVLFNTCWGSEQQSIGDDIAFCKTSNASLSTYE